MKPEARNILYYAIIPAVIAGIFTLAPKGYEILTEPKTSLSYTVVAGPKISINNEQQQVISIEITNNGSKTLTNVNAELNITSGSIEAVTPENNSGLTLSSNIYSNKAIISTPVVHPGESFSISSLIKTTSPNQKPNLTVRSNETLGEKKTEENKPSLSWKTALAAAMGVFSAYLITSFFSARTKEEDKQPPASREDMIFFIANITDTIEAIPQSILSKDKIIYARYADLLLRYATLSDKNLEKSVTALKCLLAIKDINKKSAAKIERNLEIILKENYNPAETTAIRETAITTDEDIRLRDLIYSISIN